MSVCYLDLETTALFNASIVNLGMITVGDGKLFSTDRYYLPATKMSSEAVKVHGLTEQYLASVTNKTFEQDVEEIHRYLSQDDITSIYIYNASFDGRILNGYFEKQGLPKLNKYKCLMQGYRRVFGKSKNCKLEALATSMANEMGIDVSKLYEIIQKELGGGRLHNALFDTYLTYMIDEHYGISRRL